MSTTVINAKEDTAELAVLLVEALVKTNLKQLVRRKEQKRLSRLLIHGQQFVVKRIDSIIELNDGFAVNFEMIDEDGKKGIVSVTLDIFDVDYYYEDW